MPQNSRHLSEFIFGHLSQPDGRLRRLQTIQLGLSHPPILSPLVPREGESIEITVLVGKDIAVRSIVLHYTNDGTIPGLDHCDQQRLSLTRREITWDTLAWCYLETWTVKIPPQENGTFVQYVILATTTTGQEIYCPYLGDIESFHEPEELDRTLLRRLQSHRQPQVYNFYVENLPIPSWFREAIIYQIFIDRFADDRPLPEDLDLAEPHGGTIAGIITKLDYLADLGVNCLWLTPIFASASYHGYDPIDHRSIEPRFGTEDAVKTLIEEAHGRKIRVIFDFVANHLSNQHPAFIQACQSQNNPYFNWFRFQNWPETYDCFFDVSSQPEVNSDHPDVRNYLIESANYWLDLGCDGFRLDYANGCTHAFWSVFHHAIRQTKPDSIIFGEVVEVPSFLRSYTGRMEGCLDFKLLELIRGFFAFKALSVSQFDKILRQHFAYFGSDLLLPSFLDNHDMNRFLWIVEGDKRRLKLAALCQFTLPQPPIIYYGTEVGVSQRSTVGRLEESRLPQPWGEAQDRELFAFYRQLIQFRRQNSSILYQEIQTFLIDDDTEIYGYTRGDYRVILNNSDREQRVTLYRGERIFVTDERIHEIGENQWVFPPFSGAILNNSPESSP